MENLWNTKIINKTEPTPKDLLAIQAAYLTKMTNGKLVGSIMSLNVQPYSESDAREFKSECFLHSFRVSAPNLDYSFNLLRLVHETMKTKPFKLYSNLTGKKYDGASNEDLEKILKEILMSPEVEEAMSNLVAQSGGNK